MTMENQAPLKQIAWVSQEILRDISHELEIWFVVQDILQWWQLYPLRLGIPYGIWKDVDRSTPSDRDIVLPGMSYNFKWENGSAKVVLWARNNIRKTGSIELVNGKYSKTAFELRLETRRIVEWVINQSLKLQYTESVRRISTNLNRPRLQNNLLRYSDKDWNVYLLWAPKINHRKIHNPQTDSHKSILWLYREENKIIKYYQVINSFQETGKWAKKAYLHVIEWEAFNNFIFIKLLNDEFIMDYEIGNVAASWSVISLDIEGLLSLWKNPNENRCSLENFIIA